MRGVKKAVAVVVAVLSVFGATAFFGDDEPEPRYYTAVFSRAVQLFPGGKVRVVGVDVGEITDVRNIPGGVEVAFRVDDADVAIPANVEAAIVPMSLLGERYIQLLSSTEAGPPLQSGAVIPIERTAVPSEPDELLRSLQDYFGALDPDVVGRFVGNAANLLRGTGAELNTLIGEASSLVQTLSSKRGDLAAIIVQFDRLSRALATRQEGIKDLIRTYNTVAHTLTGNRVALEGTITGLSDAAEELASLLLQHRRPLNNDIRRLTRTSRTISRNIDALTQTGHWAKRLFSAASRAVDYDEDWLRLNNQGQELAGLIVMRLEERLMEWCSELSPVPDVCGTPRYWEQEVPALFCFDDTCAEPPKHEDTVEEQLTDAIADVPALVDSLIDRAQELSCADAPDRAACLEKKKALVKCARAGNPGACLKRRAVRISCAGEVRACIERAKRQDIRELVEALLEETVGNPEELGAAP